MKALTLLLTLPFMLGLAFGLHWLVARAAKALVWSAQPLASGEAEAFRYERRVYHTAHPEMLLVIGLALLGGLLFWGGSAWGPRWLWALGLLAVAGAVALDLLRWERVSASANFLWSQRGWGGEVQQVAIENIREISVEEQDDAGGFTLRHGTNNRLCRLQVRLANKQDIDLPWTDAGTGFDDVEALANHLRARKAIGGDRLALQRAQDAATEAARAAATQPSSIDVEALRELKRLRQGALAPDLPKAAPRSK